MSDTTKNYKDTLNLPATDFPMKANLAQREEELIKKWDGGKLYEQIRKARKGAKKYVLHDGPPYANGHIHAGHVLNKVLKDITVKVKTMQGFDAPYIPGWDCHGMPIEHKVMTELGDKAATTDAPTIRRKCEEYAMKWIDIQRQEFKRLLLLGDWDHPYLTLHKSYEAGIVETFGKILEAGYIYRGLRSIHWCIECETALAEAEIEYHPKQSPSIYVKFKVDSDVTDLFGLPADANVSFLIWTTTPWTLPANLAIAVGREFTYTAVETKDERGKTEYLILAAKLVDAVFAAAKKTPGKQFGKVKGAKLENLEYYHPFMDRYSPVILADHVTIEDGTGCVHTAPGHGKEDFAVGMKYNLPVVCPVNKSGRFTFEVPDFIEGKKVFEGNPVIMNTLKEGGHLFHDNKVEHDYPHCWRCKKPVIFRATEQWFISMEHNDLRKKVLDAIEKEIAWYPAWSSGRIGAMVRERPDWCISRQRNWGVPIPAFYCKDCGAVLANKHTTAVVQKMFAEHGAMSWFTKTAEEILPTEITCESCKSRNLAKENDIFDVWFESGSSHRSVVMENKELRYPADLYLEGSDQHRGWFQLTLIPAIAAQGKVPFKACLTHGFTLDELGRKESKSLGNTTDIHKMLKTYGADVLRLYYASVNYTNDVSISPDIFSRASDSYRKIRNTFRYLLSNLNDFDAAKHAVAYEKMEEIDRWILSRLTHVLKEVGHAYDHYEYHRLSSAVHTFCVVELSNFYLDVLKDRLYADTAGSPRRRSCQTAMHAILHQLTLILAPVLSFTCEEIWALIDKSGNSVHLQLFPQVNEKWVSAELETKWKSLLAIRDEVAKPLEQLRAAKTIGSSMEATVKLFTQNADIRKTLEAFKDQLSSLLIVSQVELCAAAPEGAQAGQELKDLHVAVGHTAHAKCQRCWNYFDSVGKDARYSDLCKRCVDVVSSLS